VDDELDLRVMVGAEEEAVVADPVPPLCASPPRFAPLSLIAAEPSFANPSPRCTPYQPTPRLLEPPPEAPWKRTREKEKNEEENKRIWGGRVKR
jgi:hypothetical protein